MNHNLSVGQGFAAWAEGNIEVYDLMGRLIHSRIGVANSLNEIPVNYGNGIFIVKAIDKDVVYSEKVYIK